jgi:hypothetical protein
MGLHPLWWRKPIGTSVGELAEPTFDVALLRDATDMDDALVDDDGWAGVDMTP